MGKSKRSNRFAATPRRRARPGDVVHTPPTPVAGTGARDVRHASMSRRQLLAELKKARASAGFGPLTDERFEHFFGQFDRLALSELITDYYGSATPVAGTGRRILGSSYDPTDEEQGPLEQGWAESRRYDKEHYEDRLDAAIAATENAVTFDKPDVPEDRVDE